MMNREDIIRMARDAGLEQTVSIAPDGSSRIVSCPPIEPLERFANLVAAAEREECAKVCDEKVEAEYATGKVDHNEMGWTQACAIAIRARREQ
jgi:acylphosphatase